MKHLELTEDEWSTLTLACATARDHYEEYQVRSQAAGLPDTSTQFAVWKAAVVALHDRLITGDGQCLNIP